MKSMEKLVAQAGVLTGERVPRLRLDFRERFDDPDPGGVFLHAMWTEKARVRLAE
jgi:hypothetical protein